MSSRELLQRIGDNLRAERARRNLSQEDLAHLAGMGPTQVARMERGEVDSGVSKFVRLAIAMNAKPADLFVGVEQVRIDRD